MKYLLLTTIKIYQLLLSFDHGIPSKLLPSIKVCIYYPSCSAYGYESIKRYGSIIGSYLAIRRILKCGPWSEGGLDPVKSLELTKWQKLLTYI